MTGRRSPLRTFLILSQRQQRKPYHSPQSTIVSELRMSWAISPFPHAPLWCHNYAQSCIRHHKSSVSKVENWILMVHDIQYRITSSHQQILTAPGKPSTTAENLLMEEIIFIHLVCTFLAPTRVYAYFTLWGVLWRQIVACLCTMQPTRHNSKRKSCKSLRLTQHWFGILEIWHIRNVRNKG
jgi:hypothetical protein